MMYGSSTFEGGGFMPSQATQTTTADPSFSSSTSRDAKPLIPLTVKQIHDALPSSDDKDDFVIDGVNVNQVKLLGLVSDKTERVTDVLFGVDDGTGRIECTRWVHEDVDTREMAAILNGMYVRVHGHLKSFQGKRQLVVYAINIDEVEYYDCIAAHDIPAEHFMKFLKSMRHLLAVTDYNEIAHHFVECIYVHAYNTKLKMQQSAAPSNQANMPTSAFTPSRAAPYNQFGGQFNGNGVVDTSTMVSNYLKQPSCLAREKGVHQDELVAQLDLPLEKILEALAHLESEGSVYSTIDECHYKSTGNG